MVRAPLATSAPFIFTPIFPHLRLHCQFCSVETTGLSSWRGWRHPPHPNRGSLTFFLPTSDRIKLSFLVLPSDFPRFFRSSGSKFLGLSFTLLAATVTNFESVNPPPFALRYTMTSETYQADQWVTFSSAHYPDRLPSISSFQDILFSILRFFRLCADRLSSPCGLCVL